jgi:hypothetical protein
MNMNGKGGKQPAGTKVATRKTTRAKNAKKPVRKSHGH